MNGEKLAILVVSCDRYSDLWHAFIELFYRYWPECQYQLYIGSNNICCDDKRVKSICIGEDKSWTDNVRKMLGEIDTPYVLMMLEDFFLEDKVDEVKIQGLLQYAINNDVDCLRLCPLPAPTKKINCDFDIGEISHKAPYCICTMPAIWKKESLLELLHPGYSAWDFEKKNSESAEGTGFKLVGSYKYYIKHHNGVERGKYYSSTIKLLKKNGIECDVSERGVINDEGLKRKLYLKLYHAVQNLRSKI